MNMKIISIIKALVGMISIYTWE